MFFFFKQKTAYGMRISDWSSYVCSSDLSYASGTAIDGAGRISSIGSSMASTCSSKAMDLLDQFTSLAGENATTANIKAASAYADNPYTQGMIDANSRDEIGRAHV